MTDSIIAKELAGIKVNETVPAADIDPEISGLAQREPKKFKNTALSTKMTCVYPEEVAKQGDKYPFGKK
jgi:hypothetical protein